MKKITDDTAGSSSSKTWKKIYRWYWWLRGTSGLYFTARTGRQNLKFSRILARTGIEAVVRNKITYLELLAVVLAVPSLRRFDEGSQLIFKKDHQVLQCILNLKKCWGRLGRFRSLVIESGLAIIHRVCIVHQEGTHCPAYRPQVYVKNSLMPIYQCSA